MKEETRSVEQERMRSVIDQTSPDGKWSFDQSVTDAFDDMLRRSIPQYDVMRLTVFELGSQFVRAQTAIVDLGCSRGEAMSPFVDRFGAMNQHVGVEISRPMWEASVERFKDYLERRTVVLYERDLREWYPRQFNASLTLCILTLQFVPIEHRQRIVRDAFNATEKGGALILVEKVLGSGADVDMEFNRRYWSLKKDNGYSEEQIQRKRLSLEGVLVPVTARWNEEILKGAGFREVDCFWRWLNFAGWIAIK